MRLLLIKMLWLCGLLLYTLSSTAQPIQNTDDDILDLMVPILTFLNIPKPEVLMSTRNAYSLPYGIGGSQSGTVICPDKKTAPNENASKCKNISSQAIELQKFISSAYVNAPVCNVPVNGNKKLYPSIQYPDHTTSDGKPDACGYNDMTLFNGLICAGDVYGYGWSSLNSIGCQAVKDSQDSSGKMWRSPYRKINNGLGDPNTFSPDMDLGTLLYSVVTKDKSLLVNWWNWIHKNTPCLQQKSELLCTHQYLVTGETTACDTWDGNVLKYPPFGKCTHTYVVTPATYACDTYKTQQTCLIRNLPRYCDTQECSLRPQDIKMIREVASYLNLKLPSQLASYDNTFTTITNAGLIFGLAAQVANKMSIYWWIDMSTRLSEDGFPLHLDGVRIFMLRLMNRGNIDNKDTLNTAAQTLVSRQPENLFFRYLNDGGPTKAPSKSTVDMFYKKCPTQHITNTAENHDQWTWQSADSEQPWLKNSSWDCRFMAELLYTKR